MEFTYNDISSLKPLSMALLLLCFMVGLLHAAETNKGEPPPYVKPELPAFPGAEGFGNMATGGRGGRVIKVTTLKPTGPGSLGEACAAKGPRIVVFDVSGVIRTGKKYSRKVVIKYSNITIAGQTAPGAGITIDGYLSNQSAKDKGNTIIRFLRIRPRARKGNNRTLELNYPQDRIIVDHLSLSWGADDTCSMCHNSNVSAQWVNIEESDIHLEGGKEAHNFGAMFGTYGRGNATMHHCLFAHHSSRAPLTGADPIDYRNNVIYNVRSGFITHPVRLNHRKPGKKFDVNLVANYCKAGPGAIIGGWLFRYPTTLTQPKVGPGKSTVTYQDRNFHDWNGGYGDLSTRYKDITTDKPHPHIPSVTQQTAEEAYETVMAVGGCLPRDAVSKRTIYEVETRTGAWGRYEPDAGLMEGMKPGKPGPDSDSDGMPDEWEKAHGLDPKNPADANKVVPAKASKGDRHKGYTYIEYYINDLADQLVANALTDYRLSKKDKTEKDFGPATKLAIPFGPPDKLVATITQPDSKRDAKWYAIQMLSRMGPEAKGAVQPLIQHIEKSFQDPTAVSYAAHALGAMGPTAREAIPVLTKVLEKDWKGPSRFGRHPVGYTAWALGRMGPDAKSAVHALGKTLTGKDSRARRPAAWALTKIGPEAVKVLDLLSKSLAKGSAHARDAFVNIGEPAMPALVKLIESNRPSAMAAEAAGMLGDKAKGAIPGLIKMASGSDPKKRSAALEALCRIDPGATGVMEALTTALQDKNMTVRHRAAKALGCAGPGASKAVPALEQALKDETLEVRGAAAEALGKIGPAGVPGLIKALSYNDPWVQLKSARALGRTQPVARAAIPHLVKSMAASDSRVRFESLVALGRTQPESRQVQKELVKAKEDRDYVVRYAAHRILDITNRRDPR